MREIFNSEARLGSRRDRRWLLGAAVLCLALAVAVGPAVAKQITGSKRGDRLIGTKQPDRINGKGGTDLIKGRGGNDTLKGGRGGDLIVGGKGIDRHLGGPGNDVLKTVDGRRDAVIDGGPGTNRCIVDTVELSIVRGCGSVHATTPGGGSGGGGGGPAPAQGLRVLTVDVTCSPAPDVLGCSFHITGDGADQAGPGTVDNGSGVTNVVGAAGSLSPPNWDALGGYTCTATGFLRVTIGTKSVDVPVPCTPSGLPGG
jgi:RTX calcium-binding nonapeptide repeat (4 copies)